jgi:hypothetical protein
MGRRDMAWGTPRFTTVVDNGNPRNRLDIAIIGDGYTASEQELFQTHVEQVIEAFRGTEPIGTYFRHFNFHRINLISAESGTDDRYASPPLKRRTALNTFYSSISDRRLVGPDVWVMTVATLSGAPWDGILVLVNYPIYGGATSPLMLVGYVSTGQETRTGRPTGSFATTAVHEAGHAIAKLMDEYTGDLPDIDFARGWSLPNLLPWANVDMNARKPKWRAWLAPNVPLPTTESDETADVIGAFEGAAYTSFAVYRPEQRCLMNGPGRDRVNRASDHFCRVCSEQWIKTIYEKSKIADAFSPAYNLPRPPLLVKATEPITFCANVVRGDDIQTTWRTKRIQDSRWRRRQHTADYADFTVELPGSGSALLTGTYWLVECILEDTSPRIRTPAIRKLARQTFTWHLVSSA